MVAPDTGWVTSSTEDGNVFGWKFAAVIGVSFLLIVY
jgi:hypothetical protein